MICCCSLIPQCLMDTGKVQGLMIGDEVTYFFDSHDLQAGVAAFLVPISFLK